MEIAALFLLLGFVVAQKAQPPTPNLDDDFTITTLPSNREKSALATLRVVDSVINLKRATSWSLSSVYLQALRRQAGGNRAKNGSSNLIPVEAGQVFLAPVTVGGQNFDVVIDSGSSDPWLVVSNFTCVDPYSGDVQDEYYCYFGPPYNASASPTYAPLSNENFNISYADGENLNGLMGYETFVFGGITVPQQEFGLVDYAAWYGDGYSSGLIGFAYSTLTSAYSGANPSQDQKGATRIYHSLFTDMYTNLGVSPVFSLAIDRDPSNGGVMALGGIPNVPHVPMFVSTPILPAAVNSSSGQMVYEFYTIDVDGFAYTDSQATQFNPYDTQNPLKTQVTANQTNVIVDSGTSLVYAPDEVADSVASLFNPPATYEEDSGAYYVDCKAAAPIFGVAINSKIFYVNPADLIVPVSENSCVSGVQPNMGGLTILGDVWMKNVIAVFDIGAEEMRFAAREFYSLTDSPTAQS